MYLKTLQQTLKELPPRDALLEHFKYYAASIDDPRDATLPPRNHFAHHIIDVQRGFCDPTFEKAPYATDHTDRIAGQIASIAPEFRAAGARTLFSYIGENMPFLNIDINSALGGLHKVTKEKGDLSSVKFSQSAFHTGNFGAYLKRKNIEILLVSGFNASACVKDTVKDALKFGFSVGVLTDLVGEDGNRAYEEFAFKDMQNLGAVLMTSAQALEILASVEPPLHLAPPAEPPAPDVCPPSSASP